MSFIERVMCMSGIRFISVILGGDTPSMAGVFSKPNRLSKVVTQPAGVLRSGAVKEKTPCGRGSGLAKAAQEIANKARIAAAEMMESCIFKLL